MTKHLHYDGESIQLPDDLSIDALIRSIDSAADGSGWIPITDSQGVVHRTRVTPGIAVRLTDSGEPKPVGAPRRAGSKDLPHLSIGF